MSQECPRCGLYSQDGAVHCDCGYDFTSHKRRRNRPFLRHTYTRFAGPLPFLILLFRGDMPGPMVFLLGVVAVTRNVLRRRLARKPTRPITVNRIREVGTRLSQTVMADTMLLRFQAGLLDLVIVLLPLSVVSSWLTRTNRPLMDQTLWISWELFVAYLAISERYWGTSIGKSYRWLHVVSADGQPLTFARTGLRASCFAFELLMSVEGASLAADSLRVAWLFLPIFLLLFGACFSTARRHNGFAALHDLATDTRVVWDQRVQETFRRV